MHNWVACGDSMLLAFVFVVLFLVPFSCLHITKHYIQSIHTLNYISIMSCDCFIKTEQWYIQLHVC